MSAIKLEIGDAVLLNSGGPTMTVSEISQDGKTATCVWIDEAGLEQQGVYDNRMLRIDEGPVLA